MNYIEKVNLWKNFKDLDKDLKLELEKMSDGELKDAFTNDIAFGTGGLRGVLGAGTDRLNIYSVRKATLGFARYLLKNFKDAKARGVCIFHDNRHQSVRFSHETANVLTTLGIKVYLFEDLRPTPELSFAVRELKAIGGVMITASHNPKEYNGYKIYDSDGCQLVPKYADMVIKEINLIEDYFNIDASGNENLITYLDTSLDEKFLEAVRGIKLRDEKKVIKAVYTPLHGCGQVYAASFLQSEGYDITPVESQMTNDPDFSHTLNSNPENFEAFIEGIKLAKKIKADIILATDPDADRLGVAVRKNDDYVLLTGNQVGAILTNYICSTRKELNKLPANGYFFTTLVSSELTIKIAKSYGLNVGISLTGFKYIGENAKLIEGKGTYIFGSEDSCGYLVSDFVRDKDSIQALYMFLEASNHYKLLGKDLFMVLDDIYKEFGYFKEDLRSINLKGLEGSQKILRIMDYFRNEEIKLQGFNIIEREDCQTHEIKNFITNEITFNNLPISNVLKYKLEDNMWFCLRPSGTEPKLKVYYGSTGITEREAIKNLENLKALVNEIIDKVK